jgi:hypothetical protein
MKEQPRILLVTSGLIAFVLIVAGMWWLSAPWGRDSTIKTPAISASANPSGNQPGANSPMPLPSSANTVNEQKKNQASPEPAERKNLLPGEEQEDMEAMITMRRQSMGETPAFYPHTGTNTAQHLSKDQLIESPSLWATFSKGDQQQMNQTISTAIPAEMTKLQTQLDKANAPDSQVSDDQKKMLSDRISDLKALQTQLQPSASGTTDETGHSPEEIDQMTKQLTSLREAVSTAGQPDSRIQKEQIPILQKRIDMLEKEISQSQ